jgi:hypothetical protein
MVSLLSAPLRPVEVFLIGIGFFIVAFTFAFTRKAKK